MHRHNANMTSSAELSEAKTGMWALAWAVLPEQKPEGTTYVTRNLTDISLY